MQYCSGYFVAVCLALPVVVAAKEEKPLTPAEAIKMVNKEVTVEMVVRSSKNALEKRHEIYLDSEEDFRDEKNLAVVITEDGASKFRDAGVEDPAEHFRGKTIRVTGTLTLKDDRPRIEVSDPKAIKLIEAQKEETSTRTYAEIWVLR
jgi:DNA/RNA endonuclease YhcR with UshA esterase domain